MGSWDVSSDAGMGAGMWCKRLVLSWWWKELTATNWCWRSCKRVVKWWCWYVKEWLNDRAELEVRLDTEKEAKMGSGVEPEVGIEH